MLSNSKKTPGQTAGQKDGQTLFQRTLLVTAGSPTMTTVVDWHLKVKDIEYNVSLTKNYCITVSMQKIDSIQKLIFKIQQILGSDELNGHAHFDHAHPQIIEIAFSSPECATCKKSVRSIYSFLRYSQF